jgi:uncharacterized protein
MENNIYLPPPDETPGQITTNQTQTKWNWKDILLISGFALVILFAGLGLIRLGARWLNLSLEDGNNLLLVSLAGLVLETVALILPIFLLGIWHKNLSWAEIGIQSCRLEWILLAGLLGTLAIPITGLVAVIIQLLLGKPLENPQLPFLAPAGFSWLGAVAMFFLGGFLVPFAEELFFRGILYRWFRQRLGAPLSIFVSSLIFGIVHGDLAVGCGAFVLGIIMAWLFEKSKSLWTTFIIHAINNSIKIALLYILLAFGLLAV